MEGERKPEDRRESSDDLQLAKNQVAEMLEQLPGLIMHPDDKEVIWRQLKEDLQKTTSALELKASVKSIQESLVKEAESIVLRRKEDRDRLNEIHGRLAAIEKGEPYKPV